MKTNVIVKLQVEGIHWWKDARDVFPEVGFLSDAHRHIFHITCKKQVFHDDREIEFIQFSRWLQRLFSEDVVQLDYKSCEMIADEIVLEIRTKYGTNRDVTIEVSEDNENGCIVNYPRS